MGLLQQLILADRIKRERDEELTRQQTIEQQSGLGFAQQAYRQGLGAGKPVQQPDGTYRTPMDPAAASAVGLMQNPGSRGAGLAQGLSLLQRLGDPQAQAALQGQVLSNTRTAQGITQDQSEEARRAGLYPGQQTLQGLNITGQQLQNQAGQLAIQKAMAPPEPMSQGQIDRQIWQQEAGAEVPRGYRPVRRYAQDPQGQPVQFVDVQPIEGTEPYRKAEEELRGREAMVTAIDDFLDQLALYGTEKGGGKAIKLRETRRRILGHYAKLLELGVLQPAEMANLEQILPDPTSMGSQFNPWAAESIGGVYDQLGETYRQSLKLSRARNWYIEAQPVLPEDAAGGR